VSIAFGVSMLASAGLVLLYLIGGRAELEGVLLGTSLGGMGVGLAIWAIWLLPSETETEERTPLASPEPVIEDAAEAADVEEVTRRKMLVRLLVGAGGLLAGALAIPSLSLGPRPGQSLFRTSWTPGARIVDADGNFLRPEDLATGTVRTVFPEGFEGASDAQTLLIKVEEGSLQMDPERVAWAPQGCVGYSKICTHAGCPVGLYRAESNELLCPCHQSTFNVLDGAVPTFGPADRPLPQLPIEVDQSGYLVAIDDFPEPVGPGFWNLERGAP
jgi:ubiquinol-cytochrome c reductase iron-sulfur subunit